MRLSKCIVMREQVHLACQTALYQAGCGTCASVNVVLKSPLGFLWNLLCLWYLPPTQIYPTVSDLWLHICFSYKIECNFNIFTPEDYFKQQYSEFINLLSAEISKHFNQPTISILQGIEEMITSSCNGNTHNVSSTFENLYSKFGLEQCVMNKCDKI